MTTDPSHVQAVDRDSAYSLFRAFGQSSGKPPFDDRLIVQAMSSLSGIPLDTCWKACRVQRIIEQRVRLFELLTDCEASKVGERMWQNSDVRLVPDIKQWSAVQDWFIRSDNPPWAPFHQEWSSARNQFQHNSTETC